MKRLAFIPAGFLLLTLLAACGDDDETAPMINEVAYAAADYRFIGPQFLPSGMTELRSNEMIIRRHICYFINHWFGFVVVATGG